jgi:wyosine [tRNA(Phe)-imidazoG37] synthetase (radical SAM superfamily)
VITFGPIPSRRLGQSLGVNHIPPKHCSYACVYCQVHCPTRMAVLRRDFYLVRDVATEVRQRIAECRRTRQPVDYVSFVPDGEPTLDTGLGEEIAAAKATGVPVAVITNGSLLWRSDVRRELAAADLVSVKIDAVREAAWRRVNRPSPQLRLEWVLGGIHDFARDFRGELLTETMLVAGANDDVENVTAVADFIRALDPGRAYLSLPTRPPFESAVSPPAEEIVVRAFAILRERLPDVELLGVEVPGEYGRTGDPLAALLAILRIHPMLESAVVDYLANAALTTTALAPLLEAGAVHRVRWRDAWFYAARTRT